MPFSMDSLILVSLVVLLRARFVTSWNNFEGIITIPSESYTNISPVFISTVCGIVLLREAELIVIFFP